MLDELRERHPEESTDSLIRRVYKTFLHWKQEGFLFHGTGTRLLAWRDDGELGAVEICIGRDKWVPPGRDAAVAWEACCRR